MNYQIIYDGMFSRIEHTDEKANGNDVFRSKERSKKALIKIIKQNKKDLEFAIRKIKEE